MTPTLQLVNFAGGLALLLYGMRIAGDGLQQAAGGRLRGWLSRLTRRRLSGAAVGAGVTVLMQSSSATTLLLVTLTGAGLVTLTQAVGVILGADVGTTLTVQLLAFDILEWAPLVVAAGVVLILTTRSRVYVYLGRALFGFGLLLVLLGAAFTAVMHSSAATIGIVVGLAVNGAVGLDSALPLVLGANVGTSATAVLASFGNNVAARRVAAAHALLKVAGVAVCYPLLVPLAAAVAWSAPDVPRQVANAHLFFNLALAAIFLPLANPVAWAVTRLVPAPAHGDTERLDALLDPMTLQSPAVAIGQATRAILQMAAVVQGMVDDMQRAFETADETLVARTRTRDDEVDRMHRVIRTYLTTLMAESRLGQDMSRREVGLLYAVNDLENIADIVDRNLGSLALKVIHQHHAFSAEGRADLHTFAEKVKFEMARAISALTLNDAPLASDVLAQAEAVAELEREMRQGHISRVQEGRKETIDSWAIHLDMLGYLRRIHAHALNLAQVVTGGY
ncbi:MAG: Na/Pi cotransporter family protein [Actinobacteria bacterium]|nr:Na/Pi cotransporter family protein [Actinomycetota bacterium]